MLLMCVRSWPQGTAAHACLRVAQADVSKMSWRTWLTLDLPPADKQVLRPLHTQSSSCGWSSMFGTGECPKAPFKRMMPQGFKLAI